MVEVKLGNNIKQIMRVKGKEINDLHEGIGISYRDIENIINSEDLEGIELKDLIKVSKYLEVSFEDLYEEIEENDVKEKRMILLMAKYTKFELDKEKCGWDRLVNTYSIMATSMEELMGVQDLREYMRNRKDGEEVSFNESVEMIIGYYKDSGEYLVEYLGKEKLVENRIDEILNDMEEIKGEHLIESYNKDKGTKVMVSREEYRERKKKELEEELLGENELEDIDERVYKVLGTNYHICGSIREEIDLDVRCGYMGEGARVCSRGN